VIAVDTSVWVKAFRRGTSAEAQRLKALLDEDEVALPIVVKLEILMGLSEANRERVMRALSGVPVLRPTDQTWVGIERWVSQAAAANERFSVADLIVAHVAVEHGARLWSADRAFERMDRLGLVETYQV